MSKSKSKFVSAHYLRYCHIHNSLSVKDIVTFANLFHFLSMNSNQVPPSFLISYTRYFLIPSYSYYLLTIRIGVNNARLTPVVKTRTNWQTPFIIFRFFMIPKVDFSTKYRLLFTLKSKRSSATLLNNLLYTLAIHSQYPPNNKVRSNFQPCWIYWV